MTGALTETAAAPAQVQAAACPLCGAGMAPADESYAMEEIFGWWRQQGTGFSPAVRAAHGAGSRVSLRRCDGCGLGRFTPVLAGSPAFYEELERSAHDWYYLDRKWEFDVAIATLRRQRAKTVLEVGSGDGRFLRQAMARAGVHRAMGVELNARAAEAARDAGLEMFAGPLERLAEQGERFDAVCAFQVLEHVADPGAFLRLLGRMTAPGGSILLGVPDQDGPIRHVRPYLHDLPPHHLTRWRAETFRRAAPALGLRVAEVRHEPLARYHFRWLLPVYAQRLAPAALRRAFRLAGAALARACEWTRVPSLPLRGHTLFVRLRAGGTA